MSCGTIDDILKWLEEQETQEDVTTEGKDLIQNLTCQLRCVRIFIKWVKDGFYLHSMRTWIKYVERLLLQEERNAIMGCELLEEALSNLSTDTLEKKLEYECHRYFERGFSILSFGFHDRSVKIDEIVLDCIDPLLGMFMYMSSCYNIIFQEVPWKNPIAAFMEKLRSIRNFIMITKSELDKLRISIRSDWWQSEDLLTKVKRLLEKAVFVSCQWLIGCDDERMAQLFLCLEVKTKHLEPEIRMSYAKFLRASAIPAGCLGIDLQALASLDSLLDNLNMLLKEQDVDSIMPLDVPQIEFLHHELSFLKYFLMDPDLEQYAETKEQTFISLLIQLEAMARRASVTHSTFFGQTNDEWNMMNFNLLKTVNLLKVEIGKIYQGIPKPSESSYLHTRDLGFLDDFLQSLDELQNHKADALSYVKNEIEIIQRELRYASSLISDAIRKLEEDEHIIARRVLDVAHEAEHVIDLISSSNLPNWYYMLWLFEVIEKMKMLTKDMTKVDKVTSSDINVENYYIHDTRLTYNVAAEEEMVGFQDETVKLIFQLISGSQRLSVTYIVGTAGSGKTTLAKNVYENRLVCSHFKVRLWLDASQIYYRRELLLTLLSSVTELTENIHYLSIDELGRLLYRSLERRCYLIVMDDMWNKKVWSDIESCLPDVHNGSRIVFTGRISKRPPHFFNKEESYMHNLHFFNEEESYMHNLRLFNNEESWELLQKKVFQKRGCPPDLYTIGKEIAKCCKGLPLSVVVIAGILKNIKESETHWGEISESLGNKDGNSGDILELSYKHLPDHLKLCFFHLGTFSKNKEIPTKKLIRMWVAKGFVQKTKSIESLEKVAEGYLTDLISRNLVFIAKNKSNGGVKSIGFHYLLHEFSIEKAKNENFSLIPFHKWLTGESYVQSILFIPSGNIHGLFYDISILPYLLRSLRVLNLEHIFLQSEKFPIWIEQLVHLRYLAIQGPLKYVPSSVANLWRLETFIVKVSNGALVNLPESLLEMAYLKDVCVNKATFSLLGGAFHPENSSESSGIESLSTVTLCHGNDTTEKLIRKLRNLRKLKCVFLISREDRFPVLDMFSKLESLNVTYHDRWISQPPLGEFSFPSTLKELTLSRFAFHWCEICEIGRRLPKLEVLKLLDKPASSREIWRVTNEGFLNLKYLRLEGLDITEWYASPGAFPCVQQLVLHSCPYLGMLPSIFGESTSLKMIKVEHCDERVAKAARKIHEKQQCLRPNRLKLLIQEDERHGTFHWFRDPELHSVPNSDSDADFDSNA